MGVQYIPECSITIFLNVYQVAGIKKKLGSCNYLAVNKQCLMLLVDSFFYPGATSPTGPEASLSRIYSHVKTHHTRWDCSGRVISSSQRPLLDNTQHSQRQTSVPPAGFEPTIPASERPQTHAFDRAATGTGFLID